MAQLRPVPIGDPRWRVVSPERFQNWCRGKYPHPNHKRAEIARRRLAARLAPKVAALLESYRCPACGRWHLGRNRVAGVVNTAVVKADRRFEVRYRAIDQKWELRDRGALVAEGDTVQAAIATLRT